MDFQKTKLKDAWIIQLKPLGDERGFFCRTFCASLFRQHGLNPHISQGNISYNRDRGTLRGMHWQTAPHQETKIVRCDQGAIHDVIVDIRPDSPTFRQWIGVDLSAENRRMLYVPEGFAHGFITLTDHTLVSYLLSTEYAPTHIAGMRYDDPAIGIEWPIKPLVISERDQKHGPFQ